MSKFKNLNSLFRSAAKTARATTTSTAAPESPPAGDAPLKQYITSLDGSSPAISHPVTKRAAKAPKPVSEPKNTPSPALLSIFPDLKSEDSVSDSEYSTEQLRRDILSTLTDDGSVVSPHSQGTRNEKALQNALDMPWFSELSPNVISTRRKEVSRMRKQKWIFKSTQKYRFDQLVAKCGNKMGAKAAVSVFERLGRDAGVKEYNTLIKLCIEEARATDDMDAAYDQVNKVDQLFQSMKEEGFQLDEETYSPILMYLIDVGMVDEFDYFYEVIKDDNPSSHARLGYYEMLLYIRVNNEEKIQELCSYISNNKVDVTISLQENYLLALCERDRQNELLQLLEIIDITKVSSFEHVVSIFKSLGRLFLESSAKKFLLAFKECGYDTKNISTLILSYATSISNLAVEDVILKFKNLHSLLDIAPSSKSYEKLILYICELHKVHAALDIVDQMCKEGFTLSVEKLNSILRASEESFDFNLVKQIYPLISRHNLKTNSETYRAMISLSVKMKDFAGAYDMLNEVKNLNLTLTAAMYNAIMAGYFRKKNIKDGLMVLKQMERADVKPDSQTYSILIANCNNECQIIKYCEELKFAGIQVTKQIFMALINAYATCGLHEKAKQVLLDKNIPMQNLNEIKSVLVSALASHGEISDALNVYEEIKKAGDVVEPKAVLSLVEYLPSEYELSRMLKLLEEIQVPDYWKDGCMRVILWCIRNKNLSSTINLLKQLKDRFSCVEFFMQALDEVFSLIAETEPTDLQIGLDLLRIIKEEELCVSLSRRSLDFLLIACARAKDLHNSRLIWKEYRRAGYPYNVTSYLRMYQALLASGDRSSAKKMLKEIPKDDFHVRMIIKACQQTYFSAKGKASRKKKVDGKINSK